MRRSLPVVKWQERERFQRSQPCSAVTGQIATGLFRIYVVGRALLITKEIWRWNVNRVCVAVQKRARPDRSGRYEAQLLRFETWLFSRELECSQRVALTTSLWMVDPRAWHLQKGGPLKKHIAPLIAHCQVLYSGSDPKIIVRHGFCIINVKHTLLPVCHISLFLLFYLPSIRMIRTTIGYPHDLMSFTLYWRRNLRFLFCDTYFFISRNYKFIYRVTGDFFPRHLTSPCARDRLTPLEMNTRIFLVVKAAGA
jgi:hypothetical protein